MSHHDGRIGVDLHQRRQLLALRIALQYPSAFVWLLKGYRFEHRARVLVVRRLIFGVVEVAPLRYVRQPFPLVAREVRYLQLVLAAGMIGGMLVHRCHDGIRPYAFPTLVGSVPARIASVRTRRFTGCRHSLRAQIHG